MLKHAYKSLKSDPVDATLVGATKWNADHYFLDAAGNPTIGALGDLAYCGAAGLVSLVAGAAGVLQSAGSGSIPAYTMNPTLTSLTVTGAITAGSVIITGGSGSISGAELAVLDGVIPGTVTASKAVVVDANKDSAAFRYLRTEYLRVGSVTTAGAAVGDVLLGSNTEGLRLTHNYGTGDSTILESYGAGALVLGAGNAARWKIAGTGHLLASTDNTYDIGATGATRPRNLHLAGYMITGGEIVIPFGSAFGWNTRSKINTGADGTITLYNNAQNNFSMLQFGGTTNAFPALKRAGTGLLARLADDSGDASLTAYAFLTPNYVSVGVNPASAGAIRLPNNGGLIYARNAANTADFALIGFDTNNNLALSPSGASVIVYSTLTKFGGITNAFPAVKRSATELHIRLADDSGYAPLVASHLYAASNQFTFGTAGTTFVRVGAGTPEGAVAAAVGSLYLRSDGGAATTLYVKETGAATNTGWVAK